MGDIEFERGLQETSSEQKATAFWIHTIDIYASMAENGHDILPTAWFENEIYPSSYTVTGTTSVCSFIAAVRMGLRETINTLIPISVRENVQTYYKRRTSYIDDIREDYVLGITNPFPNDENV